MSGDYSLVRHTLLYSVTEKIMEFISSLASRLSRQQRDFCTVGAITLAVSFLLFYRLGELALDPDEALIIEWTAALNAEYPTVWELAASFVKNGGFVHLKKESSLYPSINIYLSAFAFHLFGINPWAARLPSAIIALFTIPLFYHVSRRLINSHGVAMMATMLFATSAPLLFLMRQNRYTSATVLLTLWLILAYLGIIKRKKYAIFQFVLVIVLFFYTAYYIFCPVAFGLMCHALIFNPHGIRRKTGLLFGTMFGGISLSAPLLAKDYTWLINAVIDHVSNRAPIMVIDSIHLSAFEVNVIGMPLVTVVIYLMVQPISNLSGGLSWIAAVLWLGLMIATSSLGPIIYVAAGSMVDHLWPSFSPWLFNRLIDPRSWSLLCIAAGAILAIRCLVNSKSNAAAMLSIVVTVIMGAILAYALIYPKLWTRYLACVIAISFIPGGYLLYQIYLRKRILGVLITVLVVSSNILSIVPFTKNHYPYWDWKLPYWTYRLISGDLMDHNVLNFYTDHNYW